MIRDQSGSCESVQSIVNIAATTEAFVVTALGGVLDNAANGKIKLTPGAPGSLTAARASEQAHYNFLTSNGARAQTLTFAVPNEAIVTDTATFLTMLVQLEEAFIAACLAAAQEFSALGEPMLAQIALQIGAVEAEHRAGGRFFAIRGRGAERRTKRRGVREGPLWFRQEAADKLASLGFIGGTGARITYPGPGTIDTTGLTNLQP